MPAAQMNHVAYAAPGDADVLHLARTEVPTAGPGEILVRVQAAGVNRPDVLQRQGLYPLPAGASPILGLEIAGEVAAVGDAVAGFAVGDQVCALTNGGGYAEYAVVPASQTLVWPAGYDAVRSACLPETFFTVWANVFQMAGLAADETLLVHGGSSGIGTTAIQLARAFGARVLTTVGSEAKAEACRALGAELAINYREEDFAEAVKRHTGGKGVNVILDIMGAAYFDRNLAALAMDGRLSIIGLLGGAVVDHFKLNKVMSKRLRITGSLLRARTAAEKAAIAAELAEKVWPLLSEGHCAPVVHAVLPLAEAAEAHRLMESSVHIGKIVLRVD